MYRVTTFLVMIVVPFTATSHHSNAEYDFEVIEEFEGQVLELSWRNPHVRLSLRSVSSDGSEIIWDLEAQAANNMARRGLSPDLIEPGDIVRIAGHPSRRRSSMYLTNVLLQNGTEIKARGDTEPRWSTENIGFEQPTVATRPINDEEADGIFRVWVPAERFRNPNLPLTDTARADKEAWDSVTDDPQIGCQPLGMPGAMFSPHPIEFIKDGENIILQLEEWESVRTFHMNPDISEQSSPATRMGFSIAHWEEETLTVASRLVVTTTNIDYPYMDEHGTPQSEAVEVVERFSLSLDERTLRWTAIITDTGTLTEPFVAYTTRWEWAPGEELQPYDCAIR